MVKKTRTILFWLCVALFLVAAPAMVLYSQGYRLDFNSKKITQTGGLFLKILPKQTEVYLDGKLKEKTDFFFGSILIENLLPKKYKIEVKKEGYYTWGKTLEIKEKEVAEAKNIILFPENLNFETLSKGVERFWFSPDEKKIILLEEPFDAAQGKDESGWALKLYDLDKNIKSHLISERNIASKGAELLNLEFMENSKEANLEAGISEQIKNFSLNWDKSPAVLTAIEKIATSAEKIIISKKINNDVYSLDTAGYVSKNQERLNEKPFPVQNETEYELTVFPNFIFLQEDKTLYSLNSNSKSFEKFFDSISALKISPDAKKMLYFSDHEIWLLFLSDEFGQPAKKAGERILLLRLSEEIKNCSWLTSHYLIFNTKNQAKISEIDERDRINIAEIKNLPLSAEEIEIFWNKTDNKIYLLSKEVLYRSDILLP